MKKTIQVPATLFREGGFETEETRDADGKSTGKAFRMSISSDTPYKRYDWANDEEYWEVLDHTPGGMDESRLKAGLPILFNHKRDQHLARATSYTIDGKKCMVSGLKWSESQFAKEKRADAESGALPDTSIGYQLTDEGTCIGAKDGCPVYKFKFAIHEASLVTIPADISVGVGRQRQEGEKPELKEISIKSIDTGTEQHQKSAIKSPVMPDTVPAPAAPETQPNIEVLREDIIKKERKRVGDIQELNTHFATKGLAGRKVDTSEVAGQCILEGRSLQEFQDLVLRTELKEVAPVNTPELGMDKKEIRAFSFCRAALSLGRGRPLEGLEKEASDAHAKLLGKDVGSTGFYIPEDVMRAPAFPHGISREQMQDPKFRALFAGVYSAAGAFVPIDVLGGSLIELLRNQMVTVALGARSLSGLSGDVAIPRQTGGATASWMAEDSTHTATNQTVGQLNLKPHKLMAATAYTEQFLMQSSVDAENFVRQDLMAITAIERDRAALHGSGVSGEPQGITSSTGIATVSLASADSLTYAKVLALETTVAQGNALSGRLGYLVTPQGRQNAKVQAEISGVVGNPIWKNNMINGYPAMASNQINTTSPNAGVIFANWDDLILATWADTAILVNPYSLDLSSQIRITLRMYCDNGLRHAASFAVGKL